MIDVMNKLELLRKQEQKVCDIIVECLFDSNPQVLHLPLM